MISTPTICWQRSTKFVLAAALVFVFFSLTMAQQASRPDRGLMPNGSYSISDIENINVLNGNLNIHIPLASLPPIAGGKLSWTISAQYNSKVWDVTRYQQNDDPLTWQPYNVNTPGADGGWVIGRTYTIFFRNANDDFRRLWYPGNSGVPQWDRDLMNNNQWWKVVLRMPDGSEHEFRPTDSSSYIGGQDFLRGFYNTIPSGTPLRYYSVDGTYMFARISGTQDWTVYLPDGTQIIQTTDGVQRIQDTNGNNIKIFSDTNSTHYQDEQTGRELRLTYNSAGQGQYQVWYNTVTGVQEHIDINMTTTTVAGKLYSIQQAGCDFGGLSQVLSAQLTVVHEIVFPQTEPGVQRRFTFSYNSDSSTSATDNAIFSCPGPGAPYTRTVSYGLGELSHIETPSGSIVDYSYKYDGVHSLMPSSIGDYVSQNAITHKKITHDGTTDEWAFDVGDSFGTVTGPDGSVSSEAAFCSMPNTPGCATDKAGLTYRSVGPFSKVERHWTNLAFSGSDNRAPNGVVTLNAVVDKEYTTLTDAQGNNLKMSAKYSSFDYNGNVVQETFYDWFDPNGISRDAVGVPTGVPGGATILKVVNYSHYNQAASSTSANVYAKRSVSTGAPLILNALQQSTTGPAIAQLSYDNQSYGVAPTVGNLTTKKVWDDLDSKWITTSIGYDIYGNVNTTTDGRGKVTQIFYEDSTHALPTKVIVDPQNGTGAQTTLTSYDTSTGLVTSQTDANGQVSTIDYTNQRLGSVDPFGRPGITKAPAVNVGGTNQQRRVTTTYFDSVRQVVVATDLNAENDQLLKTRTTTDQLGRPTLTEQTEDGTTYTISVQNAYRNAMGSVTLTSSARRSTEASTDSWTRVTKDAAGRVTEVATFGGRTQPAWTDPTGVFTGAVTTTYDAQFTTVTDQAGKKRRSMVDGLGRLVEVHEPDANGNLGSTTAPVQPTRYGYDVFGNLTSVSQGLQTRSFNYDSLSRLRTAINPESGTVGYQYDDNNNLVVKTDARGVSTHFEYDAINRVTRRWYNGSSSTTSTTHNSPALPAGVGATDEVRFYYDTQSLPAGAPSYTRGSAVGRLVAQVYGSGSNGDYYAYDVLGRETLKYQQTGAINYQVSASYNLSGAIATLTYPSGHTVTQTFDNAGRLTALSGNLGDGATRTYTSDILYSPLGGLVKEKFGTNTPVYNKLFYNSRGQLAEIRESNTYTAPQPPADPANITDTSWNRGAIINHYSNQCWGMCAGSSMSDNNGNLQKQDVYIPNDDLISGYTQRWQQYDYDSLNRLNWAREVKDNSEQWKQQFTYDRWGNRTINTAVTYGVGINNKAFAVSPCATVSDPCSNRLLVPTGQSGTMAYDAAGNLTNDTYTGAGNRTYDAENKITSAWGANNQAQLYAYDASGQRIKRTVNGIETWQVYGIGGELLAEYPANGATASPQKEYGYRNGQLLITAEPPVNVALAANGGVASASSSYVCCGWNFTPAGANNGNRSGAGWGAGEGWNDTDPGNSFPDWLQVDFSGSKTISEIDVFTVQDNWQSPSTPTETMTFSISGLTGYDVQYWNGSAWTTIPGGSVTGNNKVWRKFTFNPITTTKIRVLTNASVDGYSRITELEAWQNGGSTGTGSVNWLVTDHLGTPRMVLDQTGSLANVKRHDYLPFGEELFAPTSARSGAQGYASGDGVRQHFTQKERDVETGLDYFNARYYSSAQGRFSSVDPANYQAVLNPRDPQSWNGYAYVNNKPLTRTDPDGRGFWEKFKNWINGYGFQSDMDVQAEENVRRAELKKLAATTPTNLLYVKQQDDSYIAYSVDQLNRAQVWAFSNQQRRGNVTQMSQSDYAQAARVVSTAASFVAPSVTVYRGGSTIEVRDMDVRMEDGLVQPTRGPSLNGDAAQVEKFGGAYKVESIPDELQIIQRGVNPSHYEITPKNPMPFERFVELVKQVKLIPQ